MDLSGIIFAGLAVAWAVYLIPKALRHHDEMARSRSIDRFSHTVRVLGRSGSSAIAAGARPEPRPAAESPAPKRARSKVQHTVTREAARRAASRRRRVLALLLLAVAVVAVLAWRAIVPWWSTAVPGGLILAFLVVARITVRRERRRVAAVEEDPEVEDTVGISREELAAAVTDPVDPTPLADEGSLWDPLPMTLPTYVHKARARRTVRTIELTQTAGVTSSGHDEADSALVAATGPAEETDEQAVEERKVAGA